MVRVPEHLRPYFRTLKSAYTIGTWTAAPATTWLSSRRGGWLPTGVALTMEDAARDGGRFTVAREPETIHRERPTGVPSRYWAFEEALVEDVPRVGVVELDDARVLQPHAVVITAANRMLYEQCWYFGTKRPREHPIFLNPFPPEPTRVAGRVGVLATRGDANYYHFLHDALPRLAVLEQAGVELPERWYVPAGARFQRELLALWGIGPEQIIDADQVPHLQAETLVVPGLPSTIERNPPWVSRELRERLRPASYERVPGRHLFLTRGPARNNRSITNEAAVRALLEPWGFTAFDPGQVSVAEQIRTFAEADVIVAPHGASLANLAFCSPGAAVVELFPADSMVADYFKLADGVPGLEYRYLSGIGKRVGTTRAEFVVADITVDVAALAEIVTELVVQRTGLPPGQQ